MRTQGCSGDVQYSLIGIQAHSQAFRACSYSLKGIQAHSQVFRTCSVLTQMRSLSWLHHGESHSIMTQQRSCTLIGCSHSLNDKHEHSMGVQGLFNTHSLAFTCTHKLSGAAQYSLIGLHTHSQAFRGCSILSQRHSDGSNT
jgi:hypothetical protein